MAKNKKTMKRYFIRSVKYLVALIVLYVGLMAVMHYSQHSPITFAQRWQMMFDEWRGWGMIVVSILLAATYPFFGYTKRSLEGSIVVNREQLDAAARLVGLELVSASETEMLYRAKGLRRLTMLFEDDIIVRQNGSQIEIEGLRRVAVRMAFDAERYITNKRRAE